MTPKRLALALALILAATARAEVPTPTSVLGFAPGTDGKLASYERLLRYYRALAAATPRATLVELGKSGQGRPLIALLLASGRPNRAPALALRDPRTRFDPGLVERAPAVVAITCGVHANECASPLLAARLAHELVTKTTPAFERIRRNLIVVLLPCVDPDGLERVRPWTDVVRGTRHARYRYPGLVHPRAGHDINRDFVMLTQPETRAATRLLVERWPPQLLIDVHEMMENGPRCFVPPFADPLAPEVDPLLVRHVGRFGAEMALALEREERAGVCQGVMFDAWWNGGMRNAPWRRNTIGLLIEVARARWASPVDLLRSQLRGIRGLPDLKRRVGHPRPWPGGRWRIGDVIAYQRTAVLAALDLAARRRRELLTDYVALGRRAIAAGKAGNPRGFALPAPRDARDPTALRRLGDALRRGGVEFSRDAAGKLTVVDLAQPYRAHAVSLLRPQRYPALRTRHTGEAHVPYDVAGWSLPAQMGVGCHPLRTLPAERVRIDEWPDPERPEATTTPSWFPAADSGALTLMMRLRAAGRTVRTLDSAGATALALSTKAARRPVAGDLVLLDAEDDMDRRADGLATPVIPIPARLAGTLKSWTRPLPVRRIGVHVPHVNVADVGWTRWVLEQASVPYTVVTDAMLRAGGLRRTLDAIVLADVRADVLVRGNPDYLPAAYRGGMGDAGLANLRDFVRAGGRLICSGRSTALAIRALEIDATDRLSTAYRARAPEREQARLARFACPGSILRVTVDTTHTLAAGETERAALVFTRGCPALAASEGEVIARFPASGEVLISGWLRQPEVLHSRVAALRVHRGKGDVVLFACRPVFRAQPARTIRWMLNALLR